MDVVVTGYVRRGHLEIRRRKDLSATLTRMRDGEVLITITPIKATRSQLQNRYYWGVIVELLSEHTGYTPDEIHELLKAKFIPKRLALADLNGVITSEYVIGASTTKLDTQEFSDYCESIRRWAADTLGVYIPDPDTSALWPQGATA